MNVETVEDLFDRELLRAYSIESALVDELATLEDDADVDALDSTSQTEPRDDLTELFADHRAQTEDHVARLEDAFDALDVRPEGRSTPALDGIVAEKDRFNNVVLNDAVRPSYYVGTAAEIEGLEIAVYERLLRTANHLDLPGEVTEALEANLREEVDTLERLQELGGSEEFESMLDAVVELTEYE